MSVTFSERLFLDLLEVRQPIKMRRRTLVAIGIQVDGGQLARKLGGMADLRRSLSSCHAFPVAITHDNKCEHAALHVVFQQVLWERRP